LEATNNMELDHLDQIAASAFDGYLVRKDLVRRYSRQYPVPTYVVEFLLGRYCATVDEQEIEEGLKIVERQLQDRTVRTSEQELFKARAREKGSVKLIDIVKARLDAKTDSFLVELPSLGIRDVRISVQKGRFPHYFFSRSWRISRSSSSTPSPVRTVCRTWSFSTVWNRRLTVKSM
jgi:predicted ATP-dependent Lon-type protease